MNDPKEDSGTPKQVDLVVDADPTYTLLLFDRRYPFTTVLHVIWVSRDLCSKVAQGLLTIVTSKVTKLQPYEGCPRHGTVRPEGSEENDLPSLVPVDRRYKCTLR